MIAQIAMIENWEEIDQLSVMGLPTAEKEIYYYEPFGFKIEDVLMFHVDEKKKHIALIFDAKTYYVKHEEGIYLSLVKKFEND
jgi:hypothetical protein